MKKATTTLSLCLALAAPATALDLKEWGKAGDWQILQDPNHANSCLAQASFTDGSFLRMGYVDDGKKAFLATFNPAWREFKEDHRYPVEYKLDADTYTGEAWGVKLADMPGAQMRFDDVAMLVDLAKRYTMTFMDKGAEIVKLDLKGSDAAMAQVTKCQAEHN